MTRRIVIQSLTVVGEYVPALMRGSHESRHRSIRVIRGGHPNWFVRILARLWGARRFVSLPF
jgi:hypothetical protein